MTSAFAWLDHSESDRRKALDIVDLFRDQNTRDELGIGTVRDALADSIFPGVSTLQTRAKYLLFIPWIYKTLEDRKTKSADVEGLARNREIELIFPLLASDDVDGVIGKDAKANLQRLPSWIYWTGLGVLGIRRFQGSSGQYHRSLDGFYRGRRLMRASAEDGIIDLVKPQTNWHEGLPPVPEGFPKNAKLNLTKTEAEYLRQQIMTNIPDTLFAFLVDQGEWWDPVTKPWHHPQVGNCSARIKARLLHAELFSFMMLGAVLLYNLMLAEKRASGQTEGASQAERLVSHYRKELGEWFEEIENRHHELEQWRDDRVEFWKLIREFNQRIPIPTVQFIDKWIDLVLGIDGIDALVGSQSARDHIRDREHRLKRSLARLIHPRELEKWGGAAGVGRMSYRWAQVQTILQDILRGLGKEPR